MRAWRRRRLNSRGRRGQAQFRFQPPAQVQQFGRLLGNDAAQALVIATFKDLYAIRLALQVLRRRFEKFGIVLEQMQEHPLSGGGAAATRNLDVYAADGRHLLVLA